MRYIVILLLMLSTGCSVFKSDRWMAYKHLNKALYYDPNIIGLDTIVLHDTVVVPGSMLESEVLLGPPASQPSIMESEDLTITIWRTATNTPCDTMPLQALVKGEVKPRVIYRTVEVPVDRVVECTHGDMVASGWRTWAVMAFVVCALLLFLLSLVWRTAKEKT